MEWYALVFSSCLELPESFEIKRDLGNSNLEKYIYIDSTAVTFSPVENWKWNLFLSLESGSRFLCNFSSFLSCKTGEEKHSREK